MGDPALDTPAGVEVSCLDEKDKVRDNKKEEEKDK